MNLQLNVDYRTNWGESVWVTGDIPALGCGDRTKALKLDLFGEQTWKARIELPDDTKDFTYRYFIRHENGSEKNEWGDGHHLRTAPGVKSFEIFDRWQDQPWDKPYYSVVFTDCVCKRHSRALPAEVRNGEMLISCDAPMVASDEVLTICGGCDVLGNWNPAKAIVMSDAFYPTWQAAVPLQGLPDEFEFKFLVMKKADAERLSQPDFTPAETIWEGGSNRHFDHVPATKGECMIVAGMRFVNPKAPWRGAGVAIPVFSLRSEDDFGVGEFYDLMKMADWAASTGQKFIQVLPVNDTTMTHTWTDSYPYNANSTFALHPMYLRLSEVGCLKDAERQAYYDTIARELNALEDVDYEKVNNAKNAYTRELFAQDGAKAVKSKDFKTFVDSNRSWLIPYAAYCVLRDANGSADFAAWGDMAEYTPEKLEAFVKEHQNEVNYHCWIQMHLDRARLLPLAQSGHQGRHTYRHLAHERRRMDLPPPLQPQLPGRRSAG